MKTYFVTGTDTDVGKTYFCCKLLQELNKKNFKTCGLKPVACGSDDPKLLQDYSSIKLPAHQINPFNFSDPIAPNIAAQKAKVLLSAQQIAEHCKQYPTVACDYKIIEGAGGLLVPINQHETFVDVIKQLDCEVILVVAIRLGCINHALLTYEAIKNHQLKFAGWIANDMGNKYELFDEVVATIEQFMGSQTLMAP